MVCSKIRLRLGAENVPGLFYKTKIGEKEMCNNFSFILWEISF